MTKPKPIGDRQLRGRGVRGRRRARKRKNIHLMARELGIDRGIVEKWSRRGVLLEEVLNLLTRRIMAAMLTRKFTLLGPEGVTVDDFDLPARIDIARPPFIWSMREASEDMQ